MLLVDLDKKNMNFFFDFLMAKSEAELNGFCQAILSISHIVKPSLSSISITLQRRSSFVSVLHC